METIKSQIIKLDGYNYTNKTTGEVKPYTKVSFLYPATKRGELGFDVPECTLNGDYVARLKSFMEQHSVVNVTLEDRFVDELNAYKKTIVKVNDLEF